jgi:SSS family solute:Na+ symporter
VSIPHAHVIGLGTPDWAVLGAYVALLVAVAWAASRNAAGGFFVGGRRMPAWAVACSVLASATTAATFIAVPESSYLGNLTYLMTAIGTALAIVLVALVFIPAYYRHDVTTVYDLLAVRFGTGARAAASAAFMLGRVLSSGSRLFVGALPVSMVLFNDTRPTHMLVAVAVITAAGILTACFGGVRAVIWTDVVQVVVFIGAGVAALLLLIHRIPEGPIELLDALSRTHVGDATKLTVLRTGFDLSRPAWGFNPADPYTLLTAICGFTLLMTAAYGTDHDLTQRMLTCRNATRGSGSAFLSLALHVPMVVLFLVIGLLLYVFYQRPDLMGSAAPASAPGDSRKAFLRFILDEVPTGLRGLMMAGLFAVGVGSLNSALGAMSATLVNDFYRFWRPGRGDAHYVRAGRLGTVAWGLVLGLFAAGCVRYVRQESGPLIDFVLGIMNFAYAGLLGVFLTALLTRCGNSVSVVAALGTGFLVVLLLQPSVWGWWTGLSALTRATPDTPGDWRLGELRLAFPWQLTLGVAASFVVCCAGSRRTPAHDGRSTIAPRTE